MRFARLDEARVDRQVSKANIYGRLCGYQADVI